MPTIPRSREIDATRAFRSDPYFFISRRCRELRTDVFETRLLMRKTICMSGPLAARIFYDADRFSRQGAAPEAVRATLFGKGGVQGLDGAAHAQRKRMFMSLMTRPSIQQLVTLAHQQLTLHAERWKHGETLCLYDSLLDVLTHAACRWAGVPIEHPGFERRVADIALLFDSAANTVRGHLRARAARRRCERWAAGLVRSVRAGRLNIREGMALHTVALHREPNGKAMTARIAAVELLNLLRPIAAVSVFIVQAAHAMHVHGGLAKCLPSADDAFLERFVLEVRRYYPFFPAAMARAARDFEWSGYLFRKGQRVMLDIHGTNHDERTWRNPGAFDPDRFETWDGSAYDFIAQGGGDHFTQHRCPGEWITIALMKMAVRFLARELHYEVPQQDLRLDFHHLPALPADRFIIRNEGLASATAATSSAASPTSDASRCDAPGP